MRWDPDHQSSDLIDRRGEGPGGGVLFTLLMLVLRSRFGWAGVIVLLIGYAGFQLLGGVAQQFGATSDRGAPGTDEQKRFVGFVLDDVQDTWTRKLRGYRRTELVLFTGATSTACGYGDAGDDRLQEQSRGTVSPESFTHGTSAQRVGWFRRGFESGDPNQCDTFSVPL